MASIYKRFGSPFWWVKCRDTRPGSKTFSKTIRYSTKHRVGIGADTRRAQQLCAELTLAETKVSSVSSDEIWSQWVPDYLAVYCKSPATLQRYVTIWKNISMFLAEKEIHYPKQLTRGHCMAFMAWRLAPNKSAGKYQVCHNTAQLELKILSLVMREAVLRSFSAFNPVRDLGIRRHRPREKPEFTDEHLALILAAIQKEPEPGRAFLLHSFSIARYQGCRLNETYLNPMTDVDLLENGSGVIRFRIKGGREHTAPLHRNLIPMFVALKRDGNTETYQRPKNPSRKWFDFMKRIGLRKLVPGACFHSLRVTAVTRLARSKVVSESKAMRYIAHASTTVHRGYQRLRLDDLSDCMDALD